MPESPAIIPSARVGIDAGVNGAIAVEVGGAITIYPMPKSEFEVCAFLTDLAVRYPCPEVWIETPAKGGWSVASKSSVAAFFGGLGVILGACIVNRYAVHRVDPKRWQKAVGLAFVADKSSKKTTYAQRKLALYARACELLPRVKITKDNADAALILYAGTRGLIN